MLRQIARRLRHMPILHRADFLWDPLRKPYHRLLNLNGRGVLVDVGGSVPVRIPPEFTLADWEGYEPEAVRRFAEWLIAHPGATVMDIGCAMGIYSVIALSVGQGRRVIAVDSDLSSIAMTRRMAQYYPSEGLSLVYGFIANEPRGGDLAQAVSATLAELARSAISGDPGTNSYMCLVNENAEATPHYQIDRLLHASTHKGILIKCDVEGAEQFVVEGARETLRDLRADLLLSVHPPALPTYGHSVGSLKGLSSSAGYEIDCFAVDHEEHWWCSPRASSLAAAAPRRSG